MDLNTLPTITQKSKKRLGRGHGSGRGKTAGRGTKGQKARGKIKIAFEGGQQSIIRRLPFKRGKDRNRSLGKKPLIVNVKILNLLPSKSVVDLSTLVKYHIVDKNITMVKILGDGEINIPLTVQLKCSKGARKKIEKAGGKVEETTNKVHE